MRIGIAGAGVAGLATRLAFARVGMPCDVLERRAASPGGSGLLIVANGMRALDALGVGDEVARSGLPVDSLHWQLSTGEPLGTLRLSDVFEPTDRFVAIGRARLLGLLASATDAGSVRFASEISTVRDDEHGVDVATSDGHISGSTS